VRARISLIGNDVLSEHEGGGPGAEVRLPLTGDTRSRLGNWTRRYRAADRAGDPGALAGVGGEMFGWLDQGGWGSAWVRGVGDRVLEIAVDDAGTDSARALLGLPWEVLAEDGDFLAADRTQTFVVFRSIGRRRDAAPAQPDHRDLAVMFMAAAPRGQHELDFEAEEASILGATAALPVQVIVEESGCAEFLKDRLAQDGPFEAVHVSCHGGIAEQLGPVLALETAEGDLALTTPGDFARLLGEGKAPLVFLSACRTAESGAERAAEIAEPFVRDLVRAGVPNVLGWDGSVYDADAILFSRTFYGELAGHASVPYAAAVARREVLREHRNDPRTGRHWHLARVYAGPQGAGSCCARARPKRRLRKDAGYKEFLDQANRRVPVATAQEFVGRRRQAQAVFRVFRDGGKAGVLIFGMGNLGKSSLAARIANRMPKHRTVVVYGRYDALAVFDQLVTALPGGERAACVGTWRDQIAGGGAALGAALEEMLEGPFDDRPILLIVDDLEQILEDPQPDQEVTPVEAAPGKPDAWRTSLAAVLRAFKAADTESRLLLTSRYRFPRPDGRGSDLADLLDRVQLRPMEGKERDKQWRAAERLVEREGEERGDRASELAGRAVAAAGGNPGLQEILCRPILGGELEAAGEAIEAVDAWRASGKVPEEENAAQEFFLRVSFETYRNALAEPQRVLLRAATLFSEGLPVPVTAIEAVGRGSGVADTGAALKRLVGLGLVDDWGEVRGVAHAAVNPLARPLAGPSLTKVEQREQAAAAIAPLAEAWRDEDGDFPVDPRGVEAARLALLGGAPAEIVDRAAYAAGALAPSPPEPSTSPAKATSSSPTTWSATTTPVKFRTVSETSAKTSG
jgi:hypothetical protein